ncbi:type II toxin-antitoxin system HicB family antitoxin [uncultured Clostridium sp.]
MSVEFPDLPGCLTCGDTIEEVIQRAKEVWDYTCMEWK